MLADEVLVFVAERRFEFARLVAFVGGQGGCDAVLDKGSVAAVLGEVHRLYARLGFVNHLLRDRDVVVGVVPYVVGFLRGTIQCVVLHRRNLKEAVSLEELRHIVAAGLTYRFIEAQIVLRSRHESFGTLVEFRTFAESLEEVRIEGRVLTCGVEEEIELIVEMDTFPEAAVVPEHAIGHVLQRCGS